MSKMQVTIKIPQAVADGLRYAAKGRGKKRAEIIADIVVNDAVETGAVFQCQSCHNLAPSYERHAVGEMVAVCENCWADELAKEQ
jgi:nitrous oxidase accessory protein NosD